MGGTDIQKLIVLFSLGKLLRAVRLVRAVRLFKSEYSSRKMNESYCLPGSIVPYIKRNLFNLIQNPLQNSSSLVDRL